MISPFETDAISIALAGQALPRPMTHDLTLHLLQPLRGVVRQVTIHKLVEHTFYAEILLTQGAHDYRIDARPSDAIALAVRVGALIVVARSVLDAAGVTTSDASAFPDDAKARVMVVAAQPHTREQLEHLLELHPALQLVAQATTFDEFQTQVLQAAPQIVLVADDPPDIDAFAVTDMVLQLLPTVRVVLLSPPDSEPDIRRAMRAGIRDVLVRPCSAEALYAALAS